MKVILPIAYYHPEQCAGLYIIDDIMQQAAKNGINSMMFVPTPTRNVPEGASWTKDETKEDGMIHIHRVAMYGEGKNPFHTPQYFLLNLAIGGQHGGEPAPEKYPLRYEIDYIRFYQDK